MKITGAAVLESVPFAISIKRRSRPHPPTPTKSLVPLILQTSIVALESTEDACSKRFATLTSDNNHFFHIHPSSTHTSIPTTSQNRCLNVRIPPLTRGIYNIPSWHNSLLCVEKNVRILFKRRESCQSGNALSWKMIPFPMREFPKCSL